MSAENSVELVIEGRRRDLGGFEVGRVLPWTKRRMVGPFVFFDHMGPKQMAANLPRRVDVRPHPHIGLSTITYLFAGEIVHRDSLGFHQVIRPGEVNWMTAGRGISHSERFETMREHGGLLHGIQAWIALPVEDEETAPAFVHHGADELPIEREGGVSRRVIAGQAFGRTSPVRTHSPLVYVHVELEAGASTSIPDGYTDRAAFVAAGTVRVGDENYEAGKMIVFARGSEPRIVAATPATVMLLGGEPLGERHIWWNFVSSRPERIEQAKAEWRAKKIPLPVGDADEFIPLPEEPPPPPEPMS
ncbi:MAG TPA: pirin family protein [Steroidobacteraceae bacterium]|nr:pirin family protein [Steroidobacteraceae bacterium]